jgi:ABC-type sulfate/molybdate transport systems ATPase subunit
VLLLDEPFGALDAITRTQVRDQLADELSTLRLPALVVTHSFDDATALARRIGVIDRGRLLQVASTSELLRTPATPTVASLTGANVLSGNATPGPPGAVIRLEGGGRLLTATPASGAVWIAVHPWELELADPGQCDLIDTVVSVRADQGRLIVRLGRFTIHAPTPNGRDPAIIEGRAVGLRVAPANVRVLGPVTED